eukprot:m.195091 g.195091  ORF g.195091 m.195091 type:complete len:1269 (+) comp10076_c0_seq31:2213-6019(+)
MGTALQSLRTSQTASQHGRATRGSMWAYRASAEDLVVLHARLEQALKNVEVGLYEGAQDGVASLKQLVESLHTDVHRLGPVGIAWDLVDDLGSEILCHRPDLLRLPRGIEHHRATWIWRVVRVAGELRIDLALVLGLEARARHEDRRQGGSARRVNNMATSLVLLAVLAVAAALPPLPPSNLRTDLAPPGVIARGCATTGIPISWINTEPGRNLVQTAYMLEILNASGQVIWQSGNVTSAEQQTHITIELQPQTDYRWHVRTFLANNGTGRIATPWSADALFETAPASSSLAAQWVGGHGQLRSDFTTHSSPVVRARAYVTGLGAFYLYINGQRISDHIMDPPQTVYPSRILYTTFDVTDAIVPGFNAIGALVGNYKWGYTDIWCNMTTAGGPDGCRAFYLQIAVEHEDGTQSTHHTTPDTWVARPSPIVWDHLFHGETYNASQQLAGWATLPLSAFPAGTWTPAVAMNPPTSAPGTSLGPTVPNRMPPIRILESFEPVSVTPIPAGDVLNCPARLGGVGFECEPQPACSQNVLHLSCASGVIASVDFASFGQPFGDCTHGFAVNPACDGQHTRAAVEAACVGKASCDLSIDVTALNGGVDPCPNQRKSLAVLLGGCSPAPVPPQASEYIFDFGQNMAGFATFHVNNTGLPAGTVVKLEYAELVTDLGQLENTYCTPNAHAADLRHEPCAPHQTYGDGHETPNRYIGDFNDANMTNIYIVAGPDDPDYTPFFAAAGYRYVRVTVSNGAVPQANWLTGHFAHTDVPTIGSLTLANVAAEGAGTQHTPDVLNRITHLWRISQLSNLWSIPTDCPQRERRGWMGDAQVSSDAAMFHFDMQAFYRKFLQDMRDDQTWGCASTPGPGRCGDPEGNAGSLADVVPFDGIGGWPGCPVWQVAYIVIAWNAYRHYGDLDLVVNNYPGLVALMEDFIRHASKSTGLLDTACYGDWIDFSCDGSGHITPAGTVTAFYYVYALELMADLATVSGNGADAQRYRTLYNKGVQDFNAAYYKPEASGYSPVAGGAPHGSQTSNSLAVALGAVDETTKAAITRSLLDDVTQHQNHSTGGIVGMAWTYTVLSELGLDDYALSMLLQDTFPSFGRMVQQNATALCETWLCSAHDAGGGSMNHIMFGGFHQWMSKKLGGLDTVSNTTTTGWRNIVVAPSAAAILRLRSSSMQLHTRFGLTALNWSYTPGQPLAMDLVVPIGSVADIALPPLAGMVATRIVEGDAQWMGGVWTPAAPQGVHGTGLDGRTMRVRVGSGTYRLLAHYNL